ncbi:MAG: RNA polymerase factor sigma-54 [Candidatus Omnitrophica bacterium]|nr:RNA polymerase factor sigma-54 [Candidatus Omnitrophota bacterium]MDE2222911.1 RNA polymerase factor sigma-54 [Candidatus Omnitrophota bacterium]
MQQSVAILMLPQMELRTAIEQELQNNPLLEVEYDPKEEHQLNLDQLKELSHLPRVSASEETDDEDQSEPFPVAQARSLQDHLLNQLRLEISDPAVIAIGEFIIGNIDEEGFLKVTLDEIAAAAAGADLGTVKDTLALVQNFDPVGVASRDIKECLAIQLNAQPSSLKHLALLVVADHFDMLGSKSSWNKIARKLGVSEEMIAQTVELIASLEPRPARRFGGIDQVVYVYPDVSIIKDSKGRYKVESCGQSLPQLRINYTYQKLLNKPGLQETEKAFIKEKLNGALSFIKSVQLRSSTIVEITRYILEHQKNFFEQDDAYLNPLLLKDVARAIGRNESTISRAINNKYVDTPKGVFPLKCFFCQAVTSCGPDEAVSSHAIKEEIQRMIEEEDKSSPLSDQDLQTRFKSKGLVLARRTLTKHRQALQIPPSHLRRG